MISSKTRASRFFGNCDADSDSAPGVLDEPEDQNCYSVETSGTAQQTTLTSKKSQEAPCTDSVAKSKRKRTEEHDTEACFIYSSLPSLPLDSVGQPHTRKSKGSILSSRYSYRPSSSQNNSLGATNDTAGRMDLKKQLLSNHRFCGRRNCAEQGLQVQDEKSPFLGNDKDELASASQAVTAIEAIDNESVHRICSAQVVLDLAGAIKELVENSLDANASSIGQHNSSLLVFSYRVK